jgi:hypothetical protein
MLNDYKKRERSQKLLKRLGKAVESIMDANPPQEGESYDSWMSRAGGIYKASQPKPESKPAYVPEPPKVRGYFTKGGQRYREYIGYGGRVVVEAVQGHWYDQEHDLS